MFKLKVYDTATNSYKTVDLNFREWFKLRLHGYTYWKKVGKLPFYIVHCRKHGYFTDYPHGFEGWNQGFGCPFCLKGLLKKLKEEGWVKVES